MKRKMFLTAVIAASLMLTACESKENSSTNDTSTEASTEAVSDSTEIQESTVALEDRVDGELYSAYKDFLDFTLPTAYSVSEPKWDVFQPDSEYEQGVVTWDFTFDSKNGKEMKETLISSEYIYAEVDIYTTKEIHDLSEIDSFVTLAMGHVARDEFAEKIASKYLDIEYDSFTDTFITPDGTLTILAYPPVYIGGLDDSLFDKSVEIVRDRIAGDTGWSIKNADLASVCGSKDFTFTCRYVLNEDADSEGCVEMIENMMKDFQEIVGTPQNYSFFLAQYGNEEWLMRKMHIMGEEIPDEVIDSPEYTFATDLKNKILENY